jgi:hypothetical protein
VINAARSFPVFAGAYIVARDFALKIISRIWHGSEGMRALLRSRLDSGSEGGDRSDRRSLRITLSRESSAPALAVL